MKKRILYVEDDEDTRDMVKAVLEKGGYKVEAVPDGAACISSVKKSLPDLIILDMMLPDMNGWDVFNKLLGYEKQYRAEHRIEGGDSLIKAVFLSVIPVTDERVMILKAYGVLDYIMKPFENADLLRRVRSVLE